MSKEIFELAILLSLKDAASAGADHVRGRLVAMGKEGTSALKTFDELRRGLKQGLVLGGVGIAGLAMLKGGIQSAGDFESALTELKLSIEEAGAGGAINLSKLGDQMNRFEQLGVKLGNQLPGTTKDFIDMFVALKQGGLQTETILKGAGESVAYLAVLSGSVPKELAKDFAMIGEQFMLKPEEFKPATDIFLKQFRAIGMRPEQLIEGSKFAQLRGGLPLGMKGLTGLDTMGQFLGMMKVMGLEGGIGGREIATMIMGLDPHTKEQKKADAALKKLGVNLKFFDKKGQYVGVEETIKQLQQLRPLSQQQRLDVVEKRFGTKEALGPISAFIEQGVEGYEKLKAKMAAVPGVQDQINQKMETYNAKMEAVVGTLENLKATTFTPLLNQIKPLLDSANKFTGMLQEWGSAHQGIAKIGVDLFAVGSASLVVVGGFKAMRAAWGLWRVASAIGGGESGMLNFLRTTRVETDATAAKIGSASNLSKWKNSGSRMGGALVGALKFALVGFAIEGVISDLMERAEQTAEKRKAQQGIRDLLSERGKLAEGMRTGALPMSTFNKIQELDQKIAELQVSAFNVTRTKDTVGMFSRESPFAQKVALASGEHPHLGLLERAAAAPRELFWGAKKPGEEKASAEKGVIKDLHEMSFHSAGALKSWLEIVRKSGAYSEQELSTIERLATEAYPNYSRQIEGVTTELIKSKGALTDFNSLLRETRPPSNVPFGSYRDPHSKLRTWQVPSKASGGTVERGGFVHIHTGETIVPARVTPRYRAPQIDVRRDSRFSTDAGAIHINNLGGIRIILPRGSRAAEDPEEFAEYALKAITRKVQKQRERR